MTPVRKTAITLAVLGAFVLSACEGGDGNKASDNAGSRKPAATAPTREVKKQPLTFKPGTVCNLLPKEGIEKATGLVVIKVDDQNDKDLCTFEFSDWPHHTIFVSRLSAKMARAAWKTAYTRVQTGENKHGRYLPGLGNGAVDTSSFYLVRVGASAISVLGSTQHKDERDPAADKAVAYVVNRLSH